MRSTSIGIGLEHLDVFGIAVEHGVREDDVVADREPVVVRIGCEFVELLRPRNEAHVVVADDVERRLTCGLHELGGDTVQLFGVVDLVEAVDDRLVADGDVPLDHLVENHVVHGETTEVGSDLRADAVDEGGAASGPAMLIHTQPPHSSAATAGARKPSRCAGSKSSRSGTPTTRPVVS